MGLQALQTERMRVPDQQPEDALAQRQVADRCVLLVGEPTGDEVDQPPSVTDHTQRAVPGPVIRHAETTVRSSTLCRSRSELIATTASSSARSSGGRSRP